MSENTKLTVYANGFRINGYGSVLPGARITDYMNQSKGFIAITDASVWDVKDGRKLLSTSFLNVNRASVEFVVPNT